MKFSSLLFLALIIFSIPGRGQNSLTLFNLPLLYLESPDGQILEKSQKEKSNHYWIVFSDRSNNKVYETPDESKATVSTVDFLDKFYVTGETEKFLELYKWEEGLKMEGVKKKNQLDPAKAHKIGWIKKENLLLWNRCLENKGSHFARRGFIISDPKSIFNDATSDNTDSVKVYKNPAALTANDGVKLFQMLYVYKHMGNKLLVGKVLKSNVYRVDKDVTGWIDESQFQYWEGRMYLEPNMDIKAVSERKNAGIKAVLYADKTTAIAGRDGVKDQLKTVWNEDSIKELGPGFVKRFPIFDTDVDIANTGFSTTLFAAKNGSTDLIAEDDKKISTINPAAKYFLQHAGILPDDKTLYSKFKGKNPQLFVPAWAGISVKGLTQPVFKRGIYISEDELQDLIKIFENLLFDQKLKTPRKNIYDAYQSLVVTYFDEGSQSMKSLKNTLTLDLILSKVSGLPSQSSILRKIVIGDLKEVNKVSFEQIELLQNLIRNSIDNLKNVTKDLSGSMRAATDDGVFYWIPEDYLP